MHFFMILYFLRSSWQRALQWVRGGEGKREGREEGGEGEIAIMEYENSPKLPSHRAVSSINPLTTTEEAGKSSPDDVTKEAESVSVDDKGSETSDEVEDQQ